MSLFLKNFNFPSKLLKIYLILVLCGVVEGGQKNDNSNNHMNDNNDNDAISTSKYLIKNKFGSFIRGS